MVETFGRNGQDSSLENVGPVMLGEVSESWTVDESGDHLFAGGSFAKGGTAISHWDRGDLCIAIQLALIHLAESAVTYTSNSTFPSGSAM